VPSAPRKSWDAIEAQNEAIASGSAFDISAAAQAICAESALRANMRGAKRATCAGQSVRMSESVISTSLGP
jgi:hypothetical protein